MYVDLAIDDQILLDTKFDIVVQEMDLLFNTEKCELLGDVNFGSNFEFLLWHLNPSEERVKFYIQSLLNTIDGIDAFSPQINVSIIEGEYREIFFVSISLTAGNSVKYRNYEFR